MSTMAGSIYDHYVEAVKKQLDKEELTFKSDPNYQYMLEHSNYGHVGLQYLNVIKNELKLTPEEIMRFTTFNDSFGKPETTDYGIIPPCSPTSLRYVYQSHLILKHMQDMGITNPSIVEIGGGYGGLCMAVHMYASKFGVTPKLYSIIDLEVPGKLQKRVLDMNGYTSVEFCNAEKFGSDITTRDSFLISAYAFSEIQPELQKHYVDVLFPKVSHGFIAWNCIPVYDFGKEIRLEDERPLTGPINKFVYF